MTDSKPTRFLRAAETMSRLGVRRTAFEKLVAGGALHPIKVGGVRVFIEGEVEDFARSTIAAQRGQPAEV